MSPPSSGRNRWTSPTGSSETREFCQGASLRVVEKTTFSTASSHWAIARSRGSAFSSWATVGQ
jgi:hypothetical protein